MPRYYFPSWDGDHFVPDPDGLDCQGIEDARAEALRGLSEMARDIIPEATAARVLRIEVTGEAGDPQLDLRLTFEMADRG